MTIDVLGNDNKAVFAADVTTAAPPASAASAAPAAWPLPSTVYSIGFQLAGGKRVVLLSNTNNTAAAATVEGAKGATIHTVDASAGFGAVPYRTAKLAGDQVQLAASAFSLIELAP